MATFLLFAALTPQGMANLLATPERLPEVNREIEALGGRVLRQWALLGPYDFLTVVEAADAATVERIAVEIASRGSASLTTLSAIPIDDFLAGLEGPP